MSLATSGSDGSEQPRAGYVPWYSTHGSRGPQGRDVAMLDLSGRRPRSILAMDRAWRLPTPCPLPDCSWITRYTEVIPVLCRQWTLGGIVGQWPGANGDHGCH